jgi:putative SOS response-associated peptidase YedK
MPVMLDPAAFGQWLDPEASRDDLTALLRPAPDDAVRAFRISTRVNKVAHDDPDVMAPLDQPAPDRRDTPQGRLL